VPVGFIGDAECERLASFPSQVLPGDIEANFMLTFADCKRIPQTASPAHRLGFALQLCMLHYLGFGPDDLSIAPEVVIAFLARQLDVAWRDGTVRPAGACADGTPSTDRAVPGLPRAHGRRPVRLES
jgi:hypothetical protein